MLEAVNLNKFYGSRHALESVGFTIRTGEKVGLLGLAGSGKTSVLRLLAGYGKPTLGQARLNGMDPENPEARRTLGYLPESTPLPSYMRVREYLTFRAKLKGLGRKQAADAVDRMIDAWSLQAHSHTLISKLRPVLRQQVGLADCFLANPSILMFDEPLDGIEPGPASELLETIQELSRDATLLFASKKLQNVDTLCRRAIILDKGKIAAAGRLTTLYAKYVEERIITMELMTSEPVREAFRAVPGVRAVAAAAAPDDHNRVTVRLAMPAGVDLRRELSLIAAKRGWVVLEMRLEPVRLEDLFHRLNKGGDTWLPS